MTLYLPSLHETFNILHSEKHLVTDSIGHLPICCFFGDFLFFCLTTAYCLLVLRNPNVGWSPVYQAPAMNSIARTSPSRSSMVIEMP